MGPIFKFFLNFTFVPSTNQNSNIAIDLKHGTMSFPSRRTMNCCYQGCSGRQCQYCSGCNASRCREHCGGECGSTVRLNSSVAALFPVHCTHQQSSCNQTTHTTSCTTSIEKKLESVESPPPITPQQAPPPTTSPTEVLTHPEPQDDPIPIQQPIPTPLVMEISDSVKTMPIKEIVLPQTIVDLISELKDLIQLYVKDGGVYSDKLNPTMTKIAVAVMAKYPLGIPEFVIEMIQTDLKRPLNELRKIMEDNLEQHQRLKLLNEQTSVSDAREAFKHILRNHMVERVEREVTKLKNILSKDDKSETSITMRAVITAHQEALKPDNLDKLSQYMKNYIERNKKSCFKWSEPLKKSYIEWYEAIENLVKIHNKLSHLNPGVKVHWADEKAAFYKAVKDLWPGNPILEHKYGNKYDNFKKDFNVDYDAKTVGKKRERTEEVDVIRDKKKISHEE
jgi:hypothetical protein